MNLKVDYIKNETRTKNGKDFTIYSIKSGDTWYSCFDNDYKKICQTNKTNEVKKDDTIEVETVAKEYNGKTFWNIKPVDKLALLEERVKVLEDKLNNVSKITVKENGETEKELFE